MIQASAERQQKHCLTCHTCGAGRLLVRGIETADIQSLTHTLPHKLTPFAHVEGTRITYPALAEDESAPAATNLPLFEDSPVPETESQTAGEHRER